MGRARPAFVWQTQGRRRSRRLRGSDFGGTAARPAASGEVVRRGAAAFPTQEETPKGGERSEPQCGICTFFRRRRWEKCERGKHRKSRRAPFLAECAGSCSACGGTRLSPSFCPLPLSLTARFPGILQLPAKSAHFLPHGSAGARAAFRGCGGFAAARAFASQTHGVRPPRLSHYPKNPHKKKGRLL